LKKVAKKFGGLKNSFYLCTRKTKQVLSITEWQQSKIGQVEMTV
jgi:hypothetical protein